MEDLWEWLGVDKNREILAWMGGALAVVASAWWTAFTFFRKHGGPQARASDRPDTAAKSRPTDAKAQTQRAGGRPREGRDKN